MRLKAISGIVLAVGLATPLVSISAEAQDTTFACTVLLCALSSNPSWSGVPACVAPMTQVLTSIAHGGSWPTCPQAPIADSGSQPYTCPAGAENMGLAAAPSQPDSDGRGVAVTSQVTFVADPMGAFCGVPAAAADINPIDGSCVAVPLDGATNLTVPASPGGTAGSTCLTITSAAPNPNPDYVDLATPDPTTGAPTTRVWFNTAAYN